MGVSRKNNNNKKKYMKAKPKHQQQSERTGSNEARNKAETALFMLMLKNTLLRMNLIELEL